MVRISEGGGANVRSREVTWPSARHLGKPEQTCEASSAAQQPKCSQSSCYWGKRKESAPVNGFNLITPTDKQHREQPRQHKCAQKQIGERKSYIDFDKEQKKTFVNMEARKPDQMGF